MPGIVFDRAVAYYDATRAFPEGVDEQLRDAIVRRTGAGRSAALLELGVGTGRVALPFIRDGYDYSGIDLSLPMMERMREKIAAEPSAPRSRWRLVQGDVMRLPFANHSFDVAIVVHVLHLVDDWRLTLREAARVLRPGGALVLVDNDRGRSQSHEMKEAQLNQQVGARWSAILAELGHRSPRHDQSVRALDDAVLDELRGLGAAPERVTLVEYAETPRTPREIAGRFIGRVYSGDWGIPDDIHAEASRRLRRWLEEECPSPDEPVAGTGQIRAVVARWTASG